MVELEILLAAAPHTFALISIPDQNLNSFWDWLPYCTFSLGPGLDPLYFSPKCVLGLFSVLFYDCSDIFFVEPNLRFSTVHFH